MTDRTDGRIHVLMDFRDVDRYTLFLTADRIPRVGDTISLRGTDGSLTREAWEVTGVHWEYDYVSDTVNDVTVTLRRP